MIILLVPYYNVDIFYLQKQSSSCRKGSQYNRNDRQMIVLRKSQQKTQEPFHLQVKSLLKSIMNKQITLKFFKFVGIFICAGSLGCTCFVSSMSFCPIICVSSCDARQIFPKYSLTNIDLIATSGFFLKSIQDPNPFHNVYKVKY